jgi:cyclohexanone monooxygenase
MTIPEHTPQPVDLAEPAEPAEQYDVIVIGAGFAGLYALHRLRNQLGLRVRVFEKGAGVGGTWYWNRYPGARCDAESIFYSYSFDPQLEQEWTWSERWAPQPEILAYLDHVADRFDLRRDITFDTTIEAARFDEANGRWVVRSDEGLQASAQFVTAAVGNLSASQVPHFHGLDTFHGPVYHTGQWPHEGVDFTGMRVGVIGTGSSGIQAIPQIAQQAEHVTVFQRTPHYSVPAHNRPLSEEEVAKVKAEYRELREAARTSPGGLVQDPPVGSALELDEAERTRELERRWSIGGPTFVGTFTDNVTDPAANEVSAQFVRDKIRAIVPDPQTAQLLTPTDYPIGTKRICVDTAYYDTYNRDNVTLVSVRERPITRIAPEGVVVGDELYPLDAIVFATGFDAMTGPLLRIDIRGRGDLSLRDAWAHGPRTYLGVSSAGFPNLFFVTGPGSPSVLSNMVVSIEQHVEWISDLIAHLRQAGATNVEVEPEVQDKWVEHVNELAARTLYPGTASWYMGANIPGKPRVFMPYIGGVGRFREVCDEVAAKGYQGFRISGSESAAGSKPSASELTETVVQA